MQAKFKQLCQASGTNKHAFVPSIEHAQPIICMTIRLNPLLSDDFCFRCLSQAGLNRIHLQLKSPLCPGVTTALRSARNTSSSRAPTTYNMYDYQTEEMLKYRRIYSTNSKLKNWSKIHVRFFSHINIFFVKIYALHSQNQH